MLEQGMEQEALTAISGRVGGSPRPQVPPQAPAEGGAIPRGWVSHV